MSMNDFKKLWVGLRDRDAVKYEKQFINIVDTIKKKYKKILMTTKFAVF